MRKIFVAVAFAAMLSGCAGFTLPTPAGDIVIPPIGGVVVTPPAGGGAVVTPPVSQAEKIVAEVQARASQVCAFLPAASTILGIFSTGSLTAATDIASAICAAINRPKAVRGGKPMVAGVVVRGTRLR